MDTRLIEIRPVKPDELQSAWDAFMADYNDYIKRYTGGERTPGRMSFESFCDIYSEQGTDFFFATYDSRIIGTFYVKNAAGGKKNLSKIWMFPEYGYNGTVPIVIKRFEEAYCDAPGWSVGDCALIRSDIEECKKDGWHVKSLIERMSDGLVIASLEKTAD